MGTGMDVGLGVRVSGIQKNFLQGDLKLTSNTLDLAIEGNGFFQVTMPNGETAYTRNGGIVTAEDPTSGNVTNLGQIQIVDFINPAGLTPQGESLFTINDASGDAIIGNPTEDQFGSIQQGMIELSNVKLVNEMVDLITAQRAYEANSKAITTSDDMLAIVNQLKT